MVGSASLLTRMFFGSLAFMTASVHGVNEARSVHGASEVQMKYKGRLSKCKAREDTSILYSTQHDGAFEIHELPVKQEGETSTTCLPPIGAGASPEENTIDSVTRHVERSVQHQLANEVTNSSRGELGSVDVHSSSMQFHEAAEARTSSQAQINAAGRDARNNTLKNMRLDDADTVCFQKVQSCFCMRSPSDPSRYSGWQACGWCESTQRAMFGSMNGPGKGRECADWIFKPEACPKYYCPEHLGTMMWCGKHFGFSSLLLVVLIVAQVTGLSSPKSEHKVSEVKHTKRTFDGFKKGLSGTRAKQCSRPFQMTANTSTTLETFYSFGRSDTIRKVLFSVIVYGFCVSLFLAVVKLSPVFMDVDSYGTMRQIFLGLYGLLQHTQMIMGFLFTFYTLGRVGHWWNLLRSVRDIQGGLHGTAMHVGAITATQTYPDPKKIWKTKWNVYRYLMLIFYYNFRGLSPIIGQLSEDDMKEFGFLEEEEKIILDQACSNPRHIVLHWLEAQVTGDLIAQKIPDQLCMGPSIALINQKIEVLRGACGTLHDENDIRAPWSFESFMFVAVRFTILLLPFSDLGDKLDDRMSVLGVGILNLTLSSMLICTFYLSMLKLLEEIKDPFGPSLDDLDVEAILMESESIIVDLLVSPLPPSRERELSKK